MVGRTQGLRKVVSDEALCNLEKKTNVKSLVSQVFNDIPDSRPHRLQ
jgi:hypothetical protein